MLRNYKELKVWQKAYQLCLEIYHATNRFPKHEGFDKIIRKQTLDPSNP